MAGPGDSVTGLVPAREGRGGIYESSPMYQNGNNSSVGDHVRSNYISFTLRSVAHDSLYVVLYVC